MGGCKCSYRTCNKVSDGKTHFYHFPVRDEKRCEQWIVNSNRSDLRGISKSQLKNKVVCENHFPENMFVNYMHERLIHSAVPTKEHTDENDIEKLSSSKREEAKSAPYNCIDIPDQNIVSTTVMNTDVKSFDKELSTMTVNVSSVTGLSFITPPEKKPNSPPYIEILTRLPNNSLHSIKRPTSQPLQNLHSKGKPKSTKEMKNVQVPKLKKVNRSVKESKNSNKNQDIPVPITVNNHKKIILPESNISHHETFHKEFSLIPEVSHDTIIPKPVKTSDPKIVTSLIVRPTVKNDATVLKSDKSPQILENIIIDAPIENSITTLINNQKTLEENTKINKSAMEIQTLLKAVINRNSNTIRNKRKYIAVLPPKPKIVKTPDTKCDEKCIIERENFSEFINEGKKVLSEFKVLLEKEKVLRRNEIAIEMMRKKRNISKPLSKSLLYARIVPFLSPETAKMVHKELFPSMRHMHNF